MLAEVTQIVGRVPVRRGRSVARAGLLPASLLLAFATAVFIGDIHIAPSEILRIVLHRAGVWQGTVNWPAVDEAIIWQIRVPRVLAAALVGASLGFAGTLFQAVLRNPLADPYVIGTSAGAQLGVAASLILPVQVAVAGFGTLQVFSFIGALATVLFVYFIARSAGKTPVVTLLLAGFVVSSFLISATTLLMQLGSRGNEILRWTFGSLQAGNLAQLGVPTMLIGIAGCAAWIVGPQLDVLLLGEEQAQHLGIPVERLKLSAIVLGSLFTAVAVSLAGVVAFVGLVVPHSMRLLYGPAHRRLLPTSAVAGAVFLIVADTIARAAVPPTELPLGVITAVIGAPFFLHLLRRGRRTYVL